MHTPGHPGHGPGFGPNFFHFAVASTSGLESIAEKNKYITSRWRFLYVIYLSVYIFMYLLNCEFVDVYT